MKILILTFLALFSLISRSLLPDKQTFNYALDENQSVIEWSGAGPGASHQGSFAVTSQGIQVVENTIKEGTFVMPIASIKNYDLPKTIKPVLIKHLKSKDFFNVALYPEATFTITKVTPVTEVAAGAIIGTNVLVTGNFSMIGNTHPLTFPARVELKDKALAVEATFKLDRTKWGMTYAADPSLKNRHIYPEVDIHLKVMAHQNEG